MHKALHQRLEATRLSWIQGPRLRYQKVCAYTARTQSCKGLGSKQIIFYVVEVSLMTLMPYMYEEMLFGWPRSSCWSDWRALFLTWRNKGGHMVQYWYSWLIIIWYITMSGHMILQVQSLYCGFLLFFPFLMFLASFCVDLPQDQAKIPLSTCISKGSPGSRNCVAPHPVEGVPYHAASIYWWTI